MSLDLYKLFIRITCDSPPSDTNRHIYCFAHNNINIITMVNKLKTFVQHSDIIYILGNTEAMSGVSSATEVKLLYQQQNLKVKLIPYQQNWINTRIESEAVVKWCQLKQIKNIIVCAPPFHIVRATMTFISVAMDANLDLKVYAANGLVNDWQKISISHQGKNRNTFNEFIGIEIDRILKYTEKGDIKSGTDIWQYFLDR